MFPGFKHLPFIGLKKHQATNAVHKSSALSVKTRICKELASLHVGSQESLKESKCTVE